MVGDLISLGGWQLHLGGLRPESRHHDTPCQPRILSLDAALRHRTSPFTRDSDIIHISESRPVSCDWVSPLCTPVRLRSPVSSAQSLSAALRRISCDSWDTVERTEFLPVKAPQDALSASLLEIPLWRYKEGICCRYASLLPSTQVQLWPYYPPCWVEHLHLLGPVIKLLPRQRHGPLHSFVIPLIAKIIPAAPKRAKSIAVENSSRHIPIRGS